ERAKSGGPRKRDKPTYQVVNWAAYNQSLRKRGMVTPYFPKGDLVAQFVMTQHFLHRSGC
ncbi:hypothetical protein, partial [Chromobacterium amazonense]|uniref:hypothetical protein n=1 Tax=Chromobacterium amazonense TaxID=1382803 RepID=UPI003F799926